MCHQEQRDTFLEVLRHQCTKFPSVCDLMGISVDLST